MNGIAQAAAAGPDLGDIETYRDGPLYDAWARWSSDAPVHRLRSAALNREFFLVLRQPLVREVLSDATTFTSRYGIFPGAHPDSPDPAAGRSLEVTEGARHRLLRTTLQPYFSPRRQQGLMDACRAVLRNKVLPHLGAGTAFDFADAAQSVSMEVFRTLLHVPEDDLPRLTHLAHTLQTPQLSTDKKASNLALSRVRAESLGYFMDLVYERLARPSPAARDVADALTSHVPEGELSATDAAVNLHTILTSTNETVRLSLAAIPVLFAQHPDQLERLRSSPGLVKTAVEEILRWTSPLMYLTRVATEDTSLAGTPIGAGQSVTLALAASNRDPDVFPDPGKFDIARTPNQHVVFGHGLHHCLGAALARVELTAALEFFAAEVGQIEVAGPLRRIASHTFVGWESVPLRLSPPGRHHRRPR